MSQVSPIGVVVVHYGTDELTLRCLRALRADEVSPKTQVVLVDNGPDVGFGARVRVELPETKVIEPGRNLGFAAGCNLGIAALPSVELIALVNSDMVVTPGWLLPLVETIAASERWAAASPKILFEGRFRTLSVEAAPSWRPGRGDGRELAWRLGGVRVGGRDAWADCQLVEGFWEPDEQGVWASPSAVLRVPDMGPDEPVELLVGAPPGRSVTLRSDSQELEVAAGRSWWELSALGAPAHVINNAGNRWRPDGHGVDIGFQEVDQGQWDQPRSIEAWCGGAVLLRRAYLDDTGAFDERLFLYYEDLELSIRGAGRGWEYQYDPRSVVVHRHAASAALRPLKVARLKERNRLLVIARHRSAPELGRQLVRFAAVTASYLRRDVVAALRRGDRPWWGTVRTRASALCAAAPLLPGMLAARRRDRRRLGMRSVA